MQRATQTVTSNETRRAFNAGVDAAIKIVEAWLEDGRDPLELFDKLGDAKLWTPLGSSEWERAES